MLVRGPWGCGPVDDDGGMDVEVPREVDPATFLRWRRAGERPPAWRPIDPEGPTDPEVIAEFLGWLGALVVLGVVFFSAGYLAGLYRLFGPS